MDLKKMKSEALEYNKLSDQLTSLIGQYISKYKEYKEAYSNKKGKMVDKFIKEFKEIYTELDFKIKESKRYYNKVNQIYIEYIADLQSLEFQLVISAEPSGIYDGEIYKSIRFLQTKPQSINVEIIPNICEFKINFSLNRKKDGIIIDKYSRDDISVLNDIKEYIKETRFTIESMKLAYSIIAESKNILDKSLEEVNNRDFIGAIKINEENIDIECLQDLIDVL